jgi:hypothetical protein
MRPFFRTSPSLSSDLATIWGGGKVRVPVPVTDSEGKGTGTTKEAVKLTPCSPGDPHAVEKTWNDIEPDELLEPPLVRTRTGPR